MFDQNLSAAFNELMMSNRW